MDVKPVTDRPCMIHFENGGAATQPIPANLVAMETMDSGILAKFAFDAVLANRDLIPSREPSLAEGGPSREASLSLLASWR